MPDVFILFGIIILLIIMVVAFVGAMIDREGGLLVVALIVGLSAFGLGKWWHWAAQTNTWETTAVYLIQDIDTPDGSTIQIFIVGTTIHNATLRWGRVFPEGTWVRQVESVTKTGRGVTFWLGVGTKFEIIAPNEGGPPNERIEHGN